jgi:hypothetical protein
MRRKPAPIALKPIYVAPVLDRRERMAERAYRKAAFSGKRATPAPGTFDPLEMRAGMRANLIQARAGWVVSNPLLDQTMVRHPKIDPSLPGLAWLWEVYRCARNRSLVLLPRRLAALKVCEVAAQKQAAPENPPAKVESAPDQLALFF